MYQTLYRKYRPKTFDLVYGQEVIVKTLKNIIKNKKLAHAYLFTGPRGTGKTSCAKLFAKAINCLNNTNGDACNECENCKLFNENKNPDVIEIDAASNNGVDEIREIKSKVNLVPSFSKYKVYIIDEVHMLSIGAFNALLKTLEEPPEYIIFILATTEPQKLPSTIISRCQRFDFKSISNISMKECLKNIIKNEKISIEDEALEEIIINSQGGMRDSISLLDQAFAFSEKTITVSDINELSGSPSDQEIYSFFLKILEKDYKQILSDIDYFGNKGKDFNILFQKLLKICRQLIISLKTNDRSSLEKKEIEIFEKTNDTNLYKIADAISELILKLKSTDFKKILIEISLVGLIDNLDGEKNKVSSKINSEEKNHVNVPRETSEKKENNFDVPRETLDEKTDDESLNYQNKNIRKLKQIRINNILTQSTKNDINYINDLWENIKEYLIDTNYKTISNILCDSKPIAASKNGIIITVSSNLLLNKLEKCYDKSRELINKVFSSNYKIVYITDEYWQKVRPMYAEKAKRNQLNIIDEKELLEKIKKYDEKKSVNEFYELIEMED